MVKVSAFQRVPPFAQGLVRDLRVRWALEEAGIPYETHLLEGGKQSSPEYCAWQPFGQVPAYEEEGLSLFESGAIVQHIGERCETLLPKDEKGRARAISWMYCALNTMEPRIQQLAEIDLFNADQEWAKLRRPEVESNIKRRLSQLAAALGSKDYLEDRFTAGDLMMTTVLRALRHTDLVAGQPALKAYQARCEARPAFKRALTAQMSSFESARPAA